MNINKNTLQNQDIDSIETKFCSSCGKIIKKQAVFCEYCGVEL
ncbi:MAG: zinc ribbon domain-containing protein [Promethearchaeota archaeon]